MRCAGRPKDSGFHPPYRSASGIAGRETDRRNMAIYPPGAMLANRILLRAIFYLTQPNTSAYGETVMNLAYAEPDANWGQRPCEGLVPSTHTCVSGRGLAARRTHPGVGAACRGSNAADLEPRSYGGQRFCWSELRTYPYVQEKSSAPAAASQATFETAICLFRNPEWAPHLGLDLETLGVKPSAIEASGGDPFTALWCGDD